MFLAILIELPPELYLDFFLYATLHIRVLSITVKLGIKELLNKEQTGFKELFTDYQPFYTINLLLNKDLCQSRKIHDLHMI